MADESDEHVESSQSDSLIANKQDDGDHSHDGCGHSHTYNESQKKPLLYALLLTFVFVVAQIIAAAMANSLSLLADALHHLVDCIIVVTALLAVELTQRVPAESKFNRVYVDSDGHQHHYIELLFAVGNCAILVGMSLGVIIDAALRLEGHDHMEDIDAQLVVILASISLVVNIIKVYLLHSHMAASLNVRAVYIHTLADCAGAIALLAGGIVLWCTGDNDWDGIAALVIAGLVIVNVAWVIVPTTQLLCQGPDEAASGKFKEAASGGTPEGDSASEKKKPASTNPDREDEPSATPDPDLETGKGGQGKTEVEENALHADEEVPSTTSP